MAMAADRTMQTVTRDADASRRQDVRDAVRESFLGQFPPDLVERFIDEAVIVDYPEGAMIYRSGSAPYVASLVVRGLLRTYITSVDGRQLTLRYAHPGDVVGLVTLVGGPSLAHIQALSECTLLVFKPSTIRVLDPGGTRVGWVVAQELARRNYGLMDEVAINAFGTVRQRVARHLLDLAGPGANSQVLLAPVSHQEIADAVGSVRVVVARAIKGLRDDGLIETPREGIRLRDPARLHLEARVWPIDMT
jgi:CRP/FNR family transcriptional regulator